MLHTLDPSTPVAGFETARIKLSEGLTTRWIDTGSSNGAVRHEPPVVLVHGLAASLEVWRNILPGLANRRRVIAFDLPGFGHSDKPDADYRAVSFFVPKLHSFLDAAGINKAHFVGSSLGASLILRYASRYPKAVASLVCANPGGFGKYIHPFLRVPTIPGIGTLMSRPQRITNAFGASLAIHDRSKRTKKLIDEVDAFSRLPGAHRAFVRTLRGIASPFTVKELDIFETETREVARSEIPTMIVWGKHDRIFPVKQTMKAAQLMPSATINIIDGVGHYPQIDRPEYFLELIYNHLEIADGQT